MLYIIRHGQTRLNRERRWNCQADEELTEEGVRQAEAAAAKVAELPLDLIICSPLKRTKQTCGIVNRNRVPVLYDRRIMERCGGAVTGQPYEAYDHTVYYNYYTKDLPEGMEPLPVFMNRVHEFLEEIRGKYPDKNILLVTHGGVTRCIKYYFEPMPEDGQIDRGSKTENCQLRSYEW